MSAGTIHHHTPAAEGLLRGHRFRLIELLPWIVAIAVFYLFPGYRLLATQILVLILFALSVDLIVGYAGIVSLGHAAFFGTGAYTAALLANAGWQEPLTALAAAAIVAGILGLISGWIILRTHGLTLLMLTMALGIMLYELAKDLDDITGGFDGINFEVDAILGLFPFDPLYFTTNYWYALIVLFLGFLVMRTIVKSPFGWSLIGIRENVRRMHAIGTPVQQHMRQVYVISAMLAGLAGAVWVQVQGNITIGVYEFEMSGNILIMVILGGTGRLYGAFIGVIVFTLLENLTETVLGTDPPYWELVVGVALVLTVLYAPRGLLGVFDPLIARFKRPSS